MTVSSEHIYLVHNNKIDQILTEDGTPVSLSAVNRMTLAFEDLIIDSNIAGEGVGEAFNWTAGGGKLILDLAGQSIPVSSYDAQLIVYSSDNPLGIVWGTIPIEVVDVSYTPYTP